MSDTYSPIPVPPSLLDVTETELENLESRITLFLQTEEDRLNIKLEEYNLNLKAIEDTDINLIIQLKEALRQYKDLSPEQQELEKLLKETESLGILMEKKIEYVNKIKKRYIPVLEELDKILKNDSIFNPRDFADFINSMEIDLDDEI